MKTIPTRVRRDTALGTWLPCEWDAGEGSGVQPRLYRLCLCPQEGEEQEEARAKEERQEPFNCPEGGGALAGSASTPGE